MCMRGLPFGCSLPEYCFYPRFHPPVAVSGANLDHSCLICIYFEKRCSDEKIILAAAMTAGCERVENTVSGNK